MSIYSDLFGGDGETVVVGTPVDDQLKGTDGDDVILGLAGDDGLRARGGNDLVFGGRGEDWLFGDLGADVLRGGKGGDRLFGGAGNDILDGEDGADQIHGDVGRQAARGDLGNDTLKGGSGDDVLNQSEGLDSMSGGSGDDVFRFKFNNPQTALAAGTGPGFTAIGDFTAANDKLAFDVAGFGSDALGANFVNHASGGAGTSVDSFFSGAAADYMGESVAIITDQAFSAGTLVAPAITGEAAGDLLVYFNTTVGVGSLLYVTATDTAVSIARFTDVGSLADLAAKGFGADDFVYV